MSDREDLLDVARMAIDRARQSWGWLELLVESGPESHTRGRALDDHRAETLSAQANAERTYRVWNAQRGLYALAPTTAAARVEIIDAKTVVGERVMGVVLQVAGKGKGVRVLSRVSAALDWLDGRSARVGPWVAGAEGVWWRMSPLDGLSESMLGFVDTEMQRADRIARQACRIVGEARLPIAHRCPACQRRSLQLHHDGAERSWFVQCVSAACRCTGVGCGCLQRRRVEGRRHAWSRAELDGPYGLRTALAVRQRLNGTHRVSSGVEGHGGWMGRKDA